MVVLKVIFILLEVLLVFNLLIFVHELGHFLAAKWRGLKIERFAIWFGKPIWKTKINGIEYALGTIPAGGYVSLPQMATMEAVEGKTQSDAEQLPPISALDKIIVAFAGPLFSFGLAIAFAFVVWVVGRPVSEVETTTTIGYVLTNGPAAKAGLLPGDRILAVDGKPVKKFGGMGESIQWRVIRSEDPSIPVLFVRQGETNRLLVTPVKEATKAWERKSLRQIQIEPAQPAIIGRLATNSPAARAGLQPNDEVVAVNGLPVFHPALVADFIATNTGPKELKLTVVRDGRPLEVAVTPEIPLQPDDQRPRLGIVWSDGGKLRLVHPGPWEQVVDSVGALVSTLDALFSRKSDIKAQHLGGFVKIITVYYILFQSEEGWRLVLWFSVLLNVNLALLNLLPIPVLDGGHIVLALVEAVRRRPVSARLLQYIQTSCAVLLIGYMLYIMFYDVQELPWKRSRREAPEIIFAPPKPQP
jgi:regulator of sigma E protease